MLTALESPLKLSILSLINLELFKWSDIGGILNVLFIFFFIFFLFYNVQYIIFLVRCKCFLTVLNRVKIMLIKQFKNN